MRTMNLVIVAHPDDEILGFGATGAKLVKKGEIVQPTILCGNVDVRTRRPTDEDLASDIRNANATVGFSDPVLGTFPNIRMNTVDHVELVRFVERQILQYQPIRIFTHHPFDLNDDHRCVARACLAASRYFQRRDGILPLQSLHYMEIQSSTDWTFQSGCNSFQPNLYVEIQNHIDIKLQALACYRNVLRDYPHPRSIEAIRGLAAYRGGQSGQRLAEAFQTVFMRELS